MDKNNNFWNNVEIGLDNYLRKYLKIFEENYNKNDNFKDLKIDIFLKELSDKNNFETLFNHIKNQVKPLFDNLRINFFINNKEDFNKKDNEQKINTLAEFSKFFNSFIPIPRFLNGFIMIADKKKPIDLNILFVNMMKPEINDLINIYNLELKGNNKFIDKCIEDINNSNDAIEIWNLINKFGLLLQRDIFLLEYNNLNENKYNKQLLNLNEINNINFKKDIINDINDYDNFIYNLSEIEKKSISEKSTDYYYKVLPLVNILHCCYELLIDILNSTKIINQNI